MSSIQLRHPHAFGNHSSETIMHPLDNVIWQALGTRHASFAQGNGLDVAWGLAERAGSVYVASENNDAIKRFDLVSGAFLGDFVATVAHGGPAYVGFTPFPVPEPSSAALIALVAGGAWVRVRVTRRRGRAVLSDIGSNYRSEISC